jgi:hypothetical protein
MGEDAHAGARRRRRLVLEQSARRLDSSARAVDHVHATVDARCDRSGTVAVYTPLPPVLDGHWISRGEWPIIVGPWTF